MSRNRKKESQEADDSLKISPYVLPGLLLPGRGISFSLIEHIVLNAFNSNNEETIEILRSSSRKREYAEMRQTVFYFSYLYLKSYPLSLIGKKYNRDHSTVLHSVKVVKTLCETSKRFNEIVQSINTMLKAYMNPVVNGEFVEKEMLSNQNRSKATPSDYGLND